MKTAIITGVSSGIGAAIANALSQPDWQVVGLYHTTKPTAHLAGAHKVDLNDLKATTALGRSLAKEYGEVTAFIHAAGVWHTQTEPLANKQFAEFTPQQVSACMNVGVTSAMVLCNALIPAMKNGTIIGISGTFSGGAAGWLPYYTSKRALEDFLVGLSQDHHDLRVFGVSPADTATPAYQKFYPQYIAEAQSPEAVAEVARGLLLGQSKYKSGDVIEVREGKQTEGYHR